MCRSELASKDVMLADAREFWVEKTETLLIRGRTKRGAPLLYRTGRTDVKTWEKLSDRAAASRVRRLIIQTWNRWFDHSMPLPPLIVDEPRKQTRLLQPGAGDHMERRETRIGNAMRVLDATREQALFEILTRCQDAPYSAATITVDSETFGLSDSNVLEEARAAISEIEERLGRYRIVKQAMLDHWRSRSQKRPGRRRPVENYWLAAEIADIVSALRDIDVRASKNQRYTGKNRDNRRQPTVFMRILRLAFDAIHYPQSIERYAAHVARIDRPSGVDDETWTVYKQAISKAKKRAE